MFSLAAMVYIAVGTFYVCCGSGEVQSWNTGEPSKKNSDDTLKNDYIIKEEVTLGATKAE